MRRLICGIIGVVAIGLIGCQPINEPDPADTGDHLVVLFGDSLAYESAPEAQALYEADPDFRLSVNVYPGTEFDTDVWEERYPAVGNSTVLLFFGTNDLGNATLEDAKADAIAAIDMVTNAGASRVVIPTVNSAPNLDPIEVEQFNLWLAMADAKPSRYPTLEVVPWAWPITRDGTHYDEAGITAYAQLIYESREP